LLVLFLAALASAEPLVWNGSFEDGREPWRGQGETKESGSAPEGEQVLEVQGLTNSWQGPRQHFGERLGNGFEYQGSFWLRPLASAERARLGLLYQDDNGWHTALLAEVEEPVKRRWVKVVGEPVVISWKGRLRDAKVQVIVDGDKNDPPDYQVDAIEVMKGASIEELEDRFENNDSLDAAYDLGMLSQTLSAPELYIHNATDKSGPAGDRDFFRFSFEQEAPITIRLRASSGTADLGLRLYDESGQLLVESATKELSDERILRDVEPGVYTVSVDARRAHSFKRYELLIHNEGERKSIPIVINGSFEQSTIVWKTPGEAAEGSAIEGSYRLRVPGSDLWAGARQFLGSRVLPEASYSASFFVRTRTVVSRARLLLMCRDSGGWQSSALASVDSPQPRQWNEVVSEDPLNFPCTAGFEEAQIALVVDPLRGSSTTPSYEVDHVSVVACLDGDCPPPSGRCGDGKVQEHERCDDGNTVDGDSCSSDCQELSCGPDGTTCDDFDACTIGETCQAGQCQASQKVDCSGLDALCQVGVCDPTTGSCSLQPAADGSSCNDDNLCTSTDQCLSGQCGGASKDCSQGADSCHVGVCDPTTGDCSLETLADGSSCNDGSSCTELDVCTAGVCGGTTVSCDDGDPCTADSCAPTGECLHEPGHCDGGENATIRISLAGVQVAVNDGAGTHWLHSDAQGSVTAETNQAAALVRRYLYSPFGAPQDPTAVEGKPGYVGEQHDEPFLYLNARYYDPEVGTFLEVDPITDHGARSIGLNSYAYSYQNPSSLSDAGGTCPGCDLQSNTTITYTRTIGPLDEQDGNELLLGLIGAGIAASPYVIDGGLIGFTVLSPVLGDEALMTYLNYRYFQVMRGTSAFLGRSFARFAPQLGPRPAAPSTGPLAQSTLPQALAPKAQVVSLRARLAGDQTRLKSSLLSTRPLTGFAQVPSEGRQLTAAERKLIGGLYKSNWYKGYRVTYYFEGKGKLFDYIRTYGSDELLAYLKAGRGNRPAWDQAGERIQEDFWSLFREYHSFPAQADNLWILPPSP
jgi:RHS repeat-associated protein